MTFHWPQITLIILCSMGLGVAAARHGKSRGLHSVWWKCLDVAVLVWLLYAGGFFGASV